MNAVNLGIVFGPTLIRPKHEHSSSSIVHINHHSMITQLLIENPAVFIVSCLLWLLLSGFTLKYP